MVAAVYFTQFMDVVLWQYNYKSLEIIYDFCLHGWWEMGGATFAGFTTD